MSAEQSLTLYTGDGSVITIECPGVQTPFGTNWPLVVLVLAGALLEAKSTVGLDD